MSELTPTGSEYLLAPLLTANLKLVFYDGTDADSTRYVADLAGTIIARSPNLSSKTDTSGILDSANPDVSPSGSGPSFSNVLLIVDTGSDTTSPIIAVFDLDDAFVPTGVTVHVIVNPSGYFSIA